MSKETTIFGIRAIIEAIKSGETIDKVFVQKGHRSELFQELEFILRQEGINSSYVPIEKLNRENKLYYLAIVLNCHADEKTDDFTQNELYQIREDLDLIYNRMNASELIFSINICKARHFFKVYSRPTCKAIIFSISSKYSSSIFAHPIS